MKKLKFWLYIILFIISICTPLFGQYKIVSSLFSNGYQATTDYSNYYFQTVLGQVAIGRMANNSHILNNGLFYISKDFITDLDTPFRTLPLMYKLYQNYPNPFNPDTHIKFSIPIAGHVSIYVYNILGQKVKTLINEQRPAGLNIINFNAADLSSGLYFYHMVAGKSFTADRQMLLLK